MKNKGKPKSDSLFQKKGFYVALYVSLGVMLVLAAVISMNSFDRTSSNDPIPLEQDVDLSEFAQANQSSVESYLAPKTQEKAESEQSDVQVKLGDPKATAKPTASAAPTAKPTEKATEQPVSMATDKPEATQKPVDNKPRAEAQERSNDSTAVEQPSESNESAEAMDEGLEELGEPVFNAYTEESKMEWPVLGEIVMDYSMDRTTYDKTLDQYRTNDNICIAAPAGTPVKASIEGVVVKVENTRTNSNTVVIDNGNGWTTTYSQLQDGVLVKVGDIVKSGQVLGGVGNPSIYGVLLGTHLNFKVTKDERNVDPLSVLAQ